MTPNQYLIRGIFAFGFCNIDPDLGTNQLLLAIWFDFGASDCTNKRVVWFLRDPTSNQTVVATKQSVLNLDNGKLSLIDNQRILWSPRTRSGSTLELQDSGNLLFEASEGTGGGILWQSFNHPCHALLPGQTMTSSPAETYLQSKNTDKDFSLGRFTLNLQSDGNIVLYMWDPNLPIDTRWPYNSTMTNGDGNVALVTTLFFNNSGSLYYTITSNGTLVKLGNLVMPMDPSSSDVYHKYISLDPDGTLRLYVHQRISTDGTSWQVFSLYPSDDACSRKTNNSFQGMCGPNAFCKVVPSREQRLQCECPFGYVFVDEQHEYRGCRPNFVLAPAPAPTSQRRILYPIIISILAISFVSTIIYALWQCYATKNTKRRSLSTGLRTFTHKELYRATNGFKELLGKGGFGEVCKGEVNYLQPPYVAVKKLIKLNEHDESDFENEVQSIGQIHHKNLVRMIGYCKEGMHRMLVFEYMQGGTLADFIFRSERPCWSCLIKAAIGIAKGLEYLHEGCKYQIIHCDIKPENVLFDDVHTPKITDFGIAKLLGDQKTQHTITTIAGTRPYVAPEWFDGRDKVDSKVDVYSFGVMLLEMICCKRAGGQQQPNDHGHSTVSALRNWAESLIRCGRAELLVQGESEALEDIESVERFTRVAVWCLQKEPSMRPRMRKVVQMLEGTAEVKPLPDPPRIPSFSEILPTGSGTLHYRSMSFNHTHQVE
ncbi:unnamed protein product [Urochloa humidicola]